MVLGIAGCLCLSIAGCASSQCDRRPAERLSEHLLFNAEWTGSSTGVISRSDWPSTPAYADGGEHVAYRETIIDRQGDFGFSRDRLYRRFDSVREGQRRIR
jgi:hypothetical protein